MFLLEFLRLLMTNILNVCQQQKGVVGDNTIGKGKVRELPWYVVAQFETVRAQTHAFEQFSSSLLQKALPLG